MNQFIVEKQNKRNFTLWASRVLTVDPAERCIYLSRKDDVNDVTYHKVFVSKVYFWPDFGSTYVMDPMKSSRAHATFRLRGREVKTAQEDAARVEEKAHHHHGTPFTNPLSPLPAPEDGERGAQAAQHPTTASLDDISNTDNNNSSSTTTYEKGEKVHWMLRLGSVEEVAVLQKLFLAFSGCSAEGKATYVMGAGDGTTAPPTPTVQRQASGGLGGENRSNTNNFVDSGSSKSKKKNKD